MRTTMATFLSLATSTAAGVDPDFANTLATIAGVFSFGQSGQSQSHPPLPPPSNERYVN